jgi:hypothetical protein
MAAVPAQFVSIRAWRLAISKQRTWSKGAVMQCGKVDIEPLFEIDTAIDICAVIYSKGRYIL